MNWLNRYADLVYCIIRIVIGLLFACHGGIKIVGFPASQYGPATNTLGLVTGWIELICGFSIALGFFTGFGSFFASGEMAVAYFMTSPGRVFFRLQTVVKWQSSIVSSFCLSSFTEPVAGASIPH